MKKITKDTILSEVLGEKKMEAVLEKYNFPCLVCPFSKMEMGRLSLGDVCLRYGIDLERLLNELNSIE